MKIRRLWPLIGFLFALSFHASYTVLETRRLAEKWVTASNVNYFGVYVESGQYLIGLSYAIAFGFTIYALARLIESQGRGFVGLLGGVTLTGILYFAGCFLLGCCGSPMLAVYIALFGSSFAGLAKPLTFLLTLCSVGVGYFWMERNYRSKIVDGKVADACCCERSEKCNPKQRQSRL